MTNREEKIPGICSKGMKEDSPLEIMNKKWNGFVPCYHFNFTFL